jgi:ribosomal protein L11 methyltransferase
MAWLLLKIEATEQTADTISDALMEIGALSASIEDANAETADEQAIFGEPSSADIQYPPPGIWQQNIVTAMFDEGANVDGIIKALCTETGITSFKYHTETIAEQDWVRATQAQFDPIKITENLWIVPTWHAAPNDNAINIVLDPGLAFGTGSHPTTHLCLEWLTQQNLKDKSVLDYGCGSGILAIAARKLGACPVSGVDIDSQAIVSSTYNAQQNQVSVEFVDANNFNHQIFDVVVANILSSALMVLAPALAKYCKTGGKLALSGILQEQHEMLIARYSEWFNMDAPTQKDAWVLLTGTKR